MKKVVSLTLFVIMILSATMIAFGTDYYISASRGKGKEATKENPASDLGNIVVSLKPGDVVHIAGGTYLGRGDNGSDVITVPISIIGGYDDNFTVRDPWGKYKTILSGDNKSKNWVATPRLMIDLMKYTLKEMPPIVIDGVIVDHSGRNRYGTDKQMEIQRKANPKTGQMPTPDMGGLVIRVSKTGNTSPDAFWDVTIQNCVVTNTAPTQGAMSISGYKGSKIKIRNNIVINNTGSGMTIGSKFTSRDNKTMPEFLIENNTVLFTWKYDPYVQSFSGNSIHFESSTMSVVQRNVFGFSDKYGIYNPAKTPIMLKDNVVAGNIISDYLEGNTNIDIGKIEDEAQALQSGSTGNINAKLKVAVSDEWLKNYFSRVMIDRNVAEADIQAQNTRANGIRSIFGLPLLAGTLNTPSSPVFLNRISIDDAVKAGSEIYGGKYGSSMKLIK